MMTSAGEKRSNSFRNNNGALYIFEHKDGTRVCYDALNQFARMVEVNVSNLWHTFNGYKGRKWAGNWRIVEVLDFCNSDWIVIDNMLNNCKIIDRYRINEKINNIKRQTLSKILRGKGIR